MTHKETRDREQRVATRANGLPHYPQPAFFNSSMFVLCHKHRHNIHTYKHSHSHRQIHRHPAADKYTDTDTDTDTDTHTHTYTATDVHTVSGWQGMSRLHPPDVPSLGRPRERNGRQFTELRVGVVVFEEDWAVWESLKGKQQLKHERRDQQHSTRSGTCPSYARCRLLTA